MTNVWQEEEKIKIKKNINFVKCRNSKPLMVFFVIG